MADPATLALIGLGGTATGGLMGAIGSTFSGGAAASMYNYQAGLARINQNIALQNADYATSVGEVQAEQSGMKTREMVGAERAGQAAGNLDVGSGSALQVRQSQTEIGQEDQAIIRSDAAKRAYGYRVGAAQEEAQSGIFGMAASRSKTAGEIGAISSILGGASSVAAKWSQAQTAGIFGGSSGGGVNPDSPQGRITYASSIFNGQ